MAEVFDELLVSLQTQHATLRGHGSRRRVSPRASIPASATLRPTSSSSYSSSAATQRPARRPMPTTRLRRSRADEEQEVSALVSELVQVVGGHKEADDVTVPCRPSPTSPDTSPRYLHEDPDADSTLGRLLEQLDVQEDDHGPQHLHADPYDYADVTSPRRGRGMMMTTMGTAAQETQSDYGGPWATESLPASEPHQRSLSSPALFNDIRDNHQYHQHQLFTRPAIPDSICAQCNQRIPGGSPKLSALDQSYHPHCWYCVQCSRPLNTGAFFVLNGAPHCQYCAHRLSFPLCHLCNLPIKDIPARIGEHEWHRHCLRCEQCGKSLLNEPCHDQSGVPLCIPCAEPPARCSGCACVFLPGETVIGAMDRNWHERCFVCGVCRIPFSQTFYAGKDGRPYCSQHLP